VIGSRDQVSVFGELRIPLLDTLELQTSLRYEHYDDFGSTINPRIAVSYRPLDRLLLRGSWGKGFRAPALSELNLGQSLSWDVAWDPKRCPDPTFQGISACVVRSFFTVNSGNPNLEPEESESVSAGFALQLAEYLTVSVDYWQINHENRIVFPGLDWILRNEDALGPDIVVRGEPDQWDIDHGIDIPGYIDQVNNMLLNLATQEVRGYDADISYNHETGSAGTFGARLMWTHLSSHESALGSTDDPEQLAGTWGYPENRANLDMYWLRKNWQLGIYGRWIDGFADRGEDTRVPSQIKWDSQLTFSGFRNTALTLGIENLFDEDPPFSPGTSFFRGQQAFPGQYYSMRGRFFYLQASLSF
jgi:outer membrane receptor protein involved in Fe transport